MKNIVVRCFGCDVEKNMDVLEVSPTADADGLYNGPIKPIFVLDVQGDYIPNHPKGYSEFRMTVVCHTCFHALEPDMWIGKSCWEQINPVIPYDKLPMYDKDIAIQHDPMLLKHLP